MHFNAKAVDNGKEVLVAMEKRTYDLVLTDCQMPEMDGYEVTMCIRQLDSVKVRLVPIIAMTASEIRGDREKFLVGMSDYLSKLVKRKALEAMLVRWLYDETYRQELLRWFPPPNKQTPTISPTPSSIPESPITARPPLAQASESINLVTSTSTNSQSSDVTTKQEYGKDGASGTTASTNLPRLGKRRLLTSVTPGGCVTTAGYTGVRCNDHEFAPPIGKFASIYP
ncbi:hypothetical protein FS749_001837 [Ceratobasidium sp. UAMH 11750]|nr:hypothetical protein FS749_001837 [Ceratobasidium sp. UAMH 11750]